MAVKQLYPRGDFPAPGLFRRVAGAFYDLMLCVALVMVLTLAYHQGVLRLIYGPEALQAMADAGQKMGLRPSMRWPLTGAALILASWLLVLVASNRNRSGSAFSFCGSLLLAAGTACAGLVALLAGPYTHAMDPTSHVYPAIVWLLVLWSALHIFVGLLMQLYCLARRLAGRMTAKHDIDIRNVTLYWHFLLATVLITVAVIAFFPELS